MVGPPTISDVPHGNDVIKAVQADPQGLRSWFAATLAPEEVAEADGVLVSAFQ